jgi:hypothetical protein
MYTWHQICTQVIPMLSESEFTKPQSKSKQFFVQTHLDYPQLKFIFESDEGCPKGCTYLKSDLKAQIQKGQFNWEAVRTRTQNGGDPTFTFKYDPDLLIKEALEIHLESVWSFQERGS